jgi:hypothetical protein
MDGSDFQLTVLFKPLCTHAESDPALTLKLWYPLDYSHADAQSILY